MSSSRPRMVLSFGAAGTPNGRCLCTHSPSSVSTHVRLLWRNLHIDRHFTVARCAFHREGDACPLAIGQSERRPRALTDNPIFLPVHGAWIQIIRITPIALPKNFRQVAPIICLDEFNRQVVLIVDVIDTFIHSVDGKPLVWEKVVLSGAAAVLYKDVLLRFPHARRIFDHDYTTAFSSRLEYDVLSAARDLFWLDPLMEHTQH